MSINLKSLKDTNRLLFKIPLEPILGHRFQPTGFPSLGAATFQVQDGASLLVESVQSMANHLEMTIWDSAKQDVKEELEGLSHVCVTRNGGFLTDTILESHRLNSPYLLENSDNTFINSLREELGVMETGPIDRQKLADVILKYDINSLLHGVFLAKKQLAGGRLRVARALSAFIEADNVQVAPSGGVKNDHVNPQGDTKKGFGNVPFARDEYTAESITLYVNLDLAQIRGYGLGDSAERLLILLALYKIRALTDEGIRLRTACDFQLKDEDVKAFMPSQWALPTLVDLEADLTSAVATCQDRMKVSEIKFEDELKKGKAEDDATADDAEDTDNE